MKHVLIPLIYYLENLVLVYGDTFYKATTVQSVLFIILVTLYDSLVVKEWAKSIIE